MIGGLGLINTAYHLSLTTYHSIRKNILPTYQYQCDSCDHDFEILQSMLDKKLKKCPECGKNTLLRLIGAGSGIIFKGTGFYETDYKTKKPPEGSTENSPKKESGEKIPAKAEKSANSDGVKSPSSAGEKT